MIYLACIDSSEWIFCCGNLLLQPTYSETGLSLSSQIETEGNEYFLGNYNEVAYYFYYVANEITTLDYAFLGTIKEKAEMYIIYTDNCLLSADFLTRNKIFFKKIPPEIRRV